MPEFCCRECDFTTSHKTKWNLHLNTEKHKNIMVAIKKTTNEEDYEQNVMETEKDKEIIQLKQEIDLLKKDNDQLKNEMDELKQQMKDKDAQHLVDILNAKLSMVDKLAGKPKKTLLFQQFLHLQQHK